MDTASRGMDLEKELTCSICTEILYKPLTLLDCLHTFCGPCLKEWFKWQAASFQSRPDPSPGSITYTCPSCRASVRETKHNATVSTLLEILLATSPDKARTVEEQEELNSKYTPGEDILPKVEARQLTRREQRLEDEDRRLLEEVRNISLREVGVGPSEPRPRRRREDSRASDRSAVTHRVHDPESSRTARQSERERRHRDEEGERRRRRTESSVPSSYAYREERRRARNDDERRRQEERPRPAERQIEHQSSLRSLISSSDIDSREMEEEILRQIHEEGLLDGIDLENIDVTQEDQISERIAEAFRRRQQERSQEEQARRHQRRERSTDNRPPNSRPRSRNPSSDGRNNPTSSRRSHSRTPSAISQADEAPRPATATSAHLEVQSGDERRRRRRNSSSRSATVSSSTPVSGSESRPATRSQTDLSDLQQSARSREWVAAASHNRSATDPVVPRSNSTASSPPAVEARELTDSPRDSPGSLSATAEATAAPTSAPAPPAPAAPVEIMPESNPESEPLPNPAIIASPPTPGVELECFTDPSLVPAPLSPGLRSNRSSALWERAAAISSGSRPSSSHSRQRAPLYPEPSITCSRCSRTHIEYEVHYNCPKCLGGRWNICQPCFRAGQGCLNWFGFSQHSARAKWQAKILSGDLPRDAERYHMLFASRYIPPRIIEGGAEGRRTLTNEDPEKRLQSGAFCANCQAWANDCYWSCDYCNEGDWGFCNLCLNQGKCCTHPLVPLQAQSSNSHTPPLSPSHDYQAPPSASPLIGPDVIPRGIYKPMTFRTLCDICRYTIHPTEPRYHCYECTSVVANSTKGDYDICTSCYQNQVGKGRISAENGPKGWRRCLRGHRMVVVLFRQEPGQELRVISQDQVGGAALHEEPYSSPDHPQDLLKWSWADDTHARLVTRDVSMTAPSAGASGIGSELSTDFPPDGGVGMSAVASWPWYPQPGEGDNELLFPRGAEIRECKDMNGDWFLGTYMGARGLFPAPYVHVVNDKK